MRIRLVFGTLLLAVVAGSAQDLKQQTGTVVVSGRVIDAATRAPIAGAQVRLNTINPPIGYYSAHRDVAAESDGTFTFIDVPAGTIELTARLDGYLEGKIGRRRPAGGDVWFPLTEGEQFRGAEILMWREARVAGHVADESGKPLQGVTVDAWRLGANEWEGGRVAKTRSAQTDSMGDYVIEELSPGSYVIALHATKTTVRARPSSASSGSSAGALPVRLPGTLYVELPRGFPSPASVEGQPSRNYVSEFFPGGTVPDFDNPLRLSSGESRSGVDFALRLVATTRVSGRLDGPHRTNSADVMLRHAGFPSMYAHSDGVEAATLTDPDWTFTILDVPPGRYTLYERRFDQSGHTSAVENGAWSDRPIEVTVPGVRDLVVERPPVVTLRGRVILHGQPPPSAFQSAATVDVSAVHVGPAESQRGRMGTEERGTFEIPSVVPGRYLLDTHDTLNRGRWWTESITLDDRDMTGLAFDVGNVDLTQFVVTVTAVPFPLEGGIYGVDGKVAATAAVVVFPVDRARWSSARSPMVHSVRAWKGRFKFDHLPPGDYYVTAMDDARMDDWPSAAFLDRIRGGATRITMKAGQKQVVSLPLR